MLTQGSSFLATLGWMIAIPLGFLKMRRIGARFSFDCDLEAADDIRKFKSIHQNDWVFAGL
jgi:hypothetical protein